VIDLITLSIPAFFAFIGLELLVSRLQGRRVYRLNDSFDDLSCGVVSQIFGLFSGVLTFGLYLGAFALGRGALGLPEMPASTWWTWVFALIALDFLYYWFHRWSHEVNFLWACHIVHHQSEEYNLTVALRQSAFQGLFSIWVYLPLALVGVPPLVYVLVIQINTVYQFWIHTRLVQRMGPLEWVLNTPSHHRVHHGADPIYLDRNYAGMLIVWDRWFGSFVPEAAEPTYGTTTPLAHWNPLWANFDYWATLGREAKRMPRLRDRLQLWVRHPGWRPEQPQPSVSEVRGRPLYDADADRRGKVYLFAQYVGMLAATVALLFSEGSSGWVLKLCVGAWIVVTAVSVGAGFERKRWFVALEGLRLVALPVLVLLLVPGQLSALSSGSGLGALTPTLVVAAFSLLSLLGLWLLGRSNE
jgi:sterol desaturase/sphingolipid hydroxylase (fatty acid hydroxylase superfamily)